MELMSFLDDEKREDDEAKIKLLKEAAMKGSVSSLLQLLQEDSQILYKSSQSPRDTILHIASLLGQSDFVKQVLGQRPELAKELDFHGSSPLHLAAAKGSVEIVKELMSVNPDMCFVLDRDGNSPFHLGAIKGRIGVLTELARVKPEVTRVLTSGKESGLHLCVKYCRFEALKVLVECIGSEDEFVNWRDGDGNTVLHIAVAKKQLEIVKFLLASTKIDVNAQNANGFTALNVLSHSPRDLRDMDIKKLLTRARDSRICASPSISYDQDVVKVSSVITSAALTSQTSKVKQPDTKSKNTDWLGRKRSALMVVASLIATVAFQTTLSPPGGVWQDDYLVDSNGNPVDKPHKVGLSVMAYSLPLAYGQFMIFNSLAFLSSLSIILLLISGLPMKRRRWMWIQMVIMWIAITALTCTYFIALIYVTPDNAEGVLFSVIRVSVMVWLSMMGLVVIGNFIRVILWLLRKYGYIKKREAEGTANAEDDENDDL